MKKPKGMLEWFKLPETENIHDRDDPRAALVHAKIIQKKPFLKRLYQDAYNYFKDSIPDAAGKMLVELGSGGGFIKEIIPNVITSDVMDLPGLDKRFSAIEMPFADNTVDAYLMIDVLHHIEDTRLFFKEAERTLKIGGKIIMIEPANTAWSRFIHRNFHHEEFDTGGKWGTRKSGPLSSANTAIGWIVFFRDRETFEAEFPSLKITELKLHTPFRYLVSGGLSMRQLLPSFTYGIVKVVETILSPLNKYLGLFMTVKLEKRSV